MITRAEFQGAEENMSQLAELLRNSILKTALDIVRAEGFPALPEPVPGVDYGAQVAAHGAYVTGWSRALNRLESLSRPMVMPSRIPPGRQYNEEARRRMAASGLYNEEELEEFQ
jgi:hypothetical protein